MLKHVFDFLCSLIGLVILFPVFLLFAILILLTSQGGIFFRGVRVGYNGKLFRIYKFRSMIKDAEGKGKWNIGNHDKRITPIGRLIRNTKIDELPQLINIILGEMSFVGPRPELPIYVTMYTDREKPILDLKPGITDWASILHFDQYHVFSKANDPDKAYLQFIRPLKLYLQLYYWEKHDFINDMKIIFWTIFKILTRSNSVPKEVSYILLKYKKEQSKKISQ